MLTGSPRQPKDDRWQIELLGDLRVRLPSATDGKRIITRFETQKIAALLAYLAFYAHRPHSRDALIDVLWPDAEPRAARARLSSALSALRRQLSASRSLLLADSLSVQLNPARIETDVAEFEAELREPSRCESPTERRARLTRALAIYRGELLPGSSEEWVFGERSRLADAYFDALRWLVTDLEGAGEIETALGHARRGVSFDPTREEAQRDLIRLLAAACHPEAALRQYRELERRLRRDLDSEPSAETRDLAAEIAKIAHTGEAVGSPRAQSRTAGSLPVPLTPLIGREEQKTCLVEQLRDKRFRLLTLTGAGGSGKTRLALAAAADAEMAFPDGVFVDLSPLRDPDLLVSTLVHSLGLQETRGELPWVSLGRFLRGKRLLLLLDNFEQLLPAAPRVVELLSEAPSVKALVTSRAALRVRGEQEVPVEPLEMAAAVELFAQCARSVRPDFSRTPANVEAIAAICRRLDGLPLAIELAAARVRLFSPSALLSRLEHRLGLLTDGPRDLPARQQTLRDSITWSYDLLNEEEQRLFRRLSVFVGGATLEATRAVRGESLRSDLLDGLSALVDRQLVWEREGRDGEPRFGMLETIREDGGECLAASGEMEAPREAHARFFLSRAEADEGWEWRDTEHANLQAALEWFIEQGDAESGFRLWHSVGWFHRGHLTEGRLRMTMLLSLSGAQARTAMRARGLYGSGILAQAQGDFTASQPILSEALAIFREMDDRTHISFSLLRLGSVAGSQGDDETARNLLEQGLTVSREIGALCNIGDALSELGSLARKQGDYARAAARHEESMASYRAMGGREGNIANELCNLGHVAHFQGDDPRAAELFRQGLALLPDKEEAARYAYRVYRLIVANCLTGVAGVVGTTERPEQGVRLLSAAQALIAAIAAVPEPAYRAEQERYVTELRAVTEAESFAAAWAEGQTLTLEEAMAEAERLLPTR